MSNRRLRAIERLDYKELANKGEVFKRQPEGLRKMAALVAKELKIVGKIDRFFLENDLSLMIDELDIKEAIIELKILTENYVDVHIDLKTDLKDDYALTYPDYDVQIKKMVDYTRSAKKEIKSKRDNTKDLEVEKVRDKLRAEEKFFRNTIVRELDSWDDLDSEFLLDLDQYIVSAQDLIAGYTDIFIRIKELGANFHGEFGDEFEKQIQKLRDFIHRTRNKIKRIRTTEIQTKEEHDILIQNEKYENDKKEKTAFCKTLYENLCTRMSNLEARCAEVSKLNDAQVLDAKKDLRTIDSDFNDILDRSTKLCQASSVDIRETCDMVEKIDQRKQTVLKTIESFKKGLDQEIVSRDLSYEKLKNASLLGIKLSKFSGYDSTTDFYTFKADFEKLVTPRVQAKLLPDILKNNYLDGQALKIVKEIEDLGKIWERLKLSFGNVVTLMSKKLGEFECETPLCKVKGDENIVESIVKMKNCMLVLSSLAEKHEIEQNLFHTSNIVKVFNLLGKKRQVDLTETFVASEMDDKEKWTEMIKYLDNELKVKEQLILFEKSSDTSKVKTDNPVPKSGAGKAFLSNYDRTKCLICGKGDHVALISNKGKTVVNYIACKIFTSWTCKERFEFLKKQNLCYQCLTPGLKKGHSGFCFNKYKCPHESHKSFKSGLHVLICDQHKGDEANLQVLENYKAKCITGSNASYEEFSKNVGISLHAMSETFSTETESLDEDESEKAIFMTQRLRVGGRDLNLFYDSGCGDMVCRKKLVDHLSMLGKAENILKGPLILTGVGDNKSVCKYGRYSVTIPKYDGSDAKFSGICLDVVTGEFPTIPLKDIEKDIRDSYAAEGGDVKELPRLQESVGGETDLMIGIQYLKHFPKEVHKFPNGLSIYESQFLNSDGTRGIVAGPHKKVTEIYKQLGCCNMNLSAYYSDLLVVYRNAYKIEQTTSLLGFVGDSVHYKNEDEFHDGQNVRKPIPEKKLKSVKFKVPEYTGNVTERELGLDDLNLFSGFSETEYDKSDYENQSEEVYVKRRALKCVKNFEKVENVGTEASYRCVRCRGCQNCKKSAEVECISIKEEVEQGVIDNSVNVKDGYTECKLPFICDPVKKLKSNQHIAQKIYNGQVTKLNKDSDDKNDVIGAFQKLCDLGYLSKFDDLDDEVREIINSSPLKYYIPWRAVWNTNSVSTPCRPVFDASHPTDTGLSLNETLAKGKNNMNHLLQIFIRWLIHTCGFHTDIKKMYNSVRLVKEHWCYQLCLFHPELEPGKTPSTYVIKTLIYGVKSSGNQAERAIRETARLCSVEHPRQNEIIQEDVYVDDCISGEGSQELAEEVTDDLEIVLAHKDFHLKGITFAGCDPPEHLSNDDKSINVGGMKWFSESDLISLNIGPMNFGKKVRGKKSPKLKGIIPDKFTRRDCASRVGEIFDLIGRFTPLTAELKLDLSDLSTRKLDWDDPVPVDLIPKWMENFETISKMGEVKFKRCVVPEDAVSLDMDTIEMGDASLKIACSAIYVRFKRKNGLYSCQLVFGRSKILSENLSIPRGELFAATLTATTGHVVNLSLNKYLKSRICLTDSQIALFWITNKRIPQKEWIRNRQIEIERLTPDLKVWYNVDTQNMTADIGTRRGAKFKDVLDDGLWVNNHEWTKHEKKDFPIKSVQQIKLSNTDLKHVDEETLKLDLSDTGWINKQLSEAFHISQFYVCFGEGVLDRIGERYKFSNYVIDPNKFRFRKVVRIVGYMYLFITNLKRRIRKPDTVLVSENKVPNQLKFCNDKFLVTQGRNDFPFERPEGWVVELSEENLLQAMNYFYKKATLEIKEFCDENSYKKLSEEKFEILYYTGRILPSQQFTDRLNLSDVCMDLSTSTFCVPLVDKYSPLAFSVISEVHWHHDDARHCGGDTVMRYVQQIAYVIEGRSLVNTIKDDCARCRYLRKRAIEVAMGPKADENFCIAPPFYICQIDMFGPFSSFSNVNKRATTKIWFVIFVCCTTGAVDVKVTEDYTADAFILAFTRFSCKVGYPRKVLPDAGSQLVKGCNTMVITFHDIKHRLRQFGVDFEVCPVGAHYMHGKVERKIKHVKESFSKHMTSNRLSVIQWETLGDQVANAINNLPIATRYVTKNVENLDLLTPNRLMLARNNDRCPAGPIKITENVGKVIKQNNDLFEAWFMTWLISYVPTLMFQPKWFKSDRDPKIGDVVLFLKSEKEFDKQYQYGLITDLKISRDGKIRQVEVEYQNFAESVKRKTTRGTRELVVIHPVDELGLVRELNAMFGKI